MSKEAIQKAIENAKDKINNVDMSIVGQSIGISQAIDELRCGLDKIDECLHQREYEEASNIGYREIASSFVFLQRTLGGIQDVMGDKDKLVTEIAIKSGVGVYEEVAPFVDAALDSMKILTDKERAKNKELAKDSKYTYEGMRSRMEVVGNKTDEELKEK